MINLKPTPEEERKWRNYFRVQDAESVLNCYGIDTEEISEDELLKLGLALEDAIYDNVGDVEIAVLEDFGYEI